VVEGLAEGLGGLRRGLAEEQGGCFGGGGGSGAVEAADEARHCGI
jgi:hypothetical protein